MKIELRKEKRHDGTIWYCIYKNDLWLKSYTEKEVDMALLAYNMVLQGKPLEVIEIVKSDTIADGGEEICGIPETFDVTCPPMLKTKQ